MAEGHPDRGRLLAYLDDEMDAERREAVRRHLEGCPGCRRRLEELESREGLFSDVAGRLDRPVPEIPNPADRDGSGVAAGDAGGAAPLGSLGSPPLRAAAVVLLLLVGGALLTPPGRALAERAVNGIAGLFGKDPGSPVAAARQDTSGGEDPTGGRQSTAVSATASGGRLRVVIETAGPASGALRLGPPAGAHALLEGVLRDVERGPGRIRVRVDSLDGLLLRLPDSVAAGEVLVGGRRVLRQRGRSVTPGVAADTVDGDILLRVRP